MWASLCSSRFGFGVSEFGVLVLGFRVKGSKKLPGLLEVAVLLTKHVLDAKSIFQTAATC